MLALAYNFSVYEDLFSSFIYYLMSIVFRSTSLLWIHISPIKWNQRGAWEKTCILLALFVGWLTQDQIWMHEEIVSGPHCLFLVIFMSWAFLATKGQSAAVAATEWRDQKISSRPIPRLFFETKIVETETFFREQIFSRPIPRLFLRPNVIETDTDTFFRPNVFENDTVTFFET